MRVRQLRVEGDGALTVVAALGFARSRQQVRVATDHDEQCAQRICAGETRISRDGAIEQIQCGRVRGRTWPFAKSLRLLIKSKRFDVLGSLRCRLELGPESGSDRRCEFVLQLEYIFYQTIIGFGPQVEARL